MLRNRPESLADLREPVIEAFAKFIDLLGMVQVTLYQLAFAYAVYTYVYLECLLLGASQPESYK